MNLNKAREIGRRKLNLPDKVMQKAHEVAKDMAHESQHVPVMTLALAMMGVTGAVDPEELSGELTDALALISMAEKEFDLEMKGQRRQ